MKKKIIFIILVITMAISTTIPAYAEINSQIKTITFIRFYDIPFIVDKSETYTHSVVKIYTYHENDNNVLDYFYTGSGFYIENDLIVTAAHFFIDKEGKIIDDYIYYQYNISGSENRASIVSIDTTNDICILKPNSTDFMEAKPLSIDYDAKISDSKNYYAIGYPQGKYSLYPISYIENKTITARVSNVQINQDVTYSFSIKSSEKFTAHSHQGLSGGPIVDENGNVVAIEGYSDSNGNIYAMDLDVLRKLVNDYNTMIADTQDVKDKMKS